MSDVRFMQISGTSSSPSYPVQATTSSGPEKGASDSSDQAEINFSAEAFSSFVQEAGAMPEVRSELVDSFRAQIQSGSYPSQEVVAGLARLIGGTIVQQANAGLAS